MGVVMVPDGKLGKGKYGCGCFYTQLMTSS